MTLWRLFQFAVVLAAVLRSDPASAQTASPMAGKKVAEARRHPVLMISVDGLGPDTVIEADKHGLKIPVLRSFLTLGSYAQTVVNVNPTVTNPNHTTLVTGVLPREHGIFNNRPFDASGKLPQTYRLYSQIKAPTLWQAAKLAGLKTGSIFWPVTVDAKDIDFNITQGPDKDDEKIANDAIARSNKRVLIS